MDCTTGKPIEGSDHLRQSIADILATPLGTRIARRGYGSRIPELLDQPLNEATRIRVFGAAAMALLRHEPRARVQRIALAAGDKAGTATLTVTGRRTDVVDAGFAFSFPITALGALA